MKMIDNLDFCLKIFSQPPLNAELKDSNELVVTFKDSEILLDTDDINSIAKIFEEYGNIISWENWAINYVHERIFAEGLSGDDKKLYFSIPLDLSIN
tara:strand:+ start:389 stop:679 length:291 start_codon:yes stop_codon:yes gene_type:complete